MKSLSTIISSNFGLQIIGERICEECGSKVNIVHIKNQYRDEKVSQCLTCDNKQLQKEQQAYFDTLDQRKVIATFDEYSFVPDDLKNVTFSMYKPNHPTQHDAKRNLMDYVKNFKEIKNNEINSRLLQGSYGIGKSHLAYACAKEIMSKGFSVIYIDIPSLFRFLRGNITSKKFSEQTIINVFSNVDLVIFDDIGAEYVKQTSNGEESWAVEKLFELFTVRTGKPKIMTTNYNSQMLQNKYGYHGGRIISRMMKGTQKPTLQMEGKDLRVEVF